MNKALDNLVSKDSPLLKNFKEINKGVAPSLMYLSRQRNVSDFREMKRWSAIGKSLFIISGLFFTNPQRAEIIMQYVEASFNWLRSFENPFRRRRDFWTAETELAERMVEMRRAFLFGDLDTVTIKLLEIKQLSGELVEIVHEHKADPKAQFTAERV